MNKSLIILFLILISCNEKSELVKVSMIHSNNLNKGMEWKEKELTRDSLIDYKKTKIDIYFCNKIAKMPYYLPTNGIFKDSIKNKECDMSIYPRNVKCYEYDNKNRVKSMSVSGSGTMGTWNYQYDKLDRIIQIEWVGDIFTLESVSYTHLTLPTKA